MAKYKDVEEYASTLGKWQAETVMSLANLVSDNAPVDTRFAGTQTVAWVLQLVTSHTLGHAGEISAIKGTMGLQGLPM